MIKESLPLYRCNKCNSLVIVKASDNKNSRFTKYVAACKCSKPVFGRSFKRALKAFVHFNDCFIELSNDDQVAKDER